jgi:hypothetical protein
VINYFSTGAIFASKIGRKTLQQKWAHITTKVITMHGICFLSGTDGSFVHFTTLRKVEDNGKSFFKDVPEVGTQRLFLYA